MDGRDHVTHWLRSLSTAASLLFLLCLPGSFLLLPALLYVKYGQASRPASPSATWLGRLLPIGKCTPHPS